MSKEILELYKKIPVDIKKIRELLKEGNIDPSIRDKTGETLLHYACTFGPPEIIDYLTRQKTLDINAKDALGRTALFNAIQSKNSEAIMLIQARRDFNIDLRDKEGINAIQYTIKTNNLTAAKIVLGSPEMLNHQDEFGQTPLMYAVSHNNDVFKYLVKRGDLLINLRDKNGQSAIFHAINAAVDKDDNTVVKAIAKIPNIDFLHVDQDFGLTPIEFAAAFKAPELVKILQSCGASFDSPKGLIEPELFRKHRRLIKTAGHVLGLDMYVLALYDRMQVMVSASAGTDYPAACMLYDLIQRQAQSVKGEVDKKKEGEKKRTSEEETIIQLWEQSAVVTQRVVDFTKFDGSMPPEKLWELFNKGEYVVSTAGWLEHSWALGFKKPYLVHVNRGEGNETGETHFYEIHPDYLAKPAFCALIKNLNRKGTGGPKSTMLQLLRYAIDSSAPVYTIPTKSQNFGTCAIDSLQVACTEPLFFFRKQEELMRDKAWLKQNQVPDNKPFHPKVCKAAGAFARSVYKGGSNNFRNFVIDDLVQTYQSAKQNRHVHDEFTAEVAATLLFGNIYFHHGQAKPVPRNRDLKRQQEWNRVERSLQALLPQEDIKLVHEVLKTEPFDRITLAILMGTNAYIHKWCHHPFVLYDYLDKIPEHMLRKIIHNLAASGIDLNIQDKHGKTALMRAIENRKDDLIQALLIETDDYKLNLDAKDTNGHSALIYAIRARNIPLVEALLKGKADVNEVDRSGKTPLMHAIDANIPRSKMVQLLIDFKAKIDAQDKHGFTPLMFATKRGFDYIVKLLLDAGADVNIENHYHQRAEELVANPALYDLFDARAGGARAVPKSFLPQLSIPKPKVDEPPPQPAPKANANLPVLPQLNLRLRPSSDQARAEQAKAGRERPKPRKDSPRPKDEVSRRGGQTPRGPGAGLGKKPPSR